ncbi:MAG: hypothetical protein ABIK09_02590 [Pseudomonadota bacterium]
MKTLSLILVTTTGLLFGALVLAGCDRAMDDINPEPIADNTYGPGYAYPSLMVTGGSAVPPEAEKDATTGGTDTVVEEDVGGTDVDVEVFVCSGSETYCSCLEGKGNDLKYDDYCNCMDSPSVPGGDNLTYCSCCTFGYDSTFTENDDWKYMVDGTCDPQGYTSPCQYD